MRIQLTRGEWHRLHRLVRLHARVTGKGSATAIATIVGLFLGLQGGARGDLEWRLWQGLKNPARPH